MKRNSNILFLTIVSGILFTGCKKFLDKNPDSRTDVNTVEKVSNLLTSAYVQACFASFTEAMSDNAGDKPKAGFDKDIFIPYTFGDNINDAQDTPEYYWDQAYSAIAAANQALSSARNAPDTGSYKSQIGEALICRAYAHFMLVNIFSKSYDPATAATDIGIPYVTTPETIVFKQYKRGTVASVYANIESDLLEGLPLLNDNRYSTPKFHFTKKSADAFANRFYLYKQDYAKAILYANAAFPSNDFALNMRPWTTTYKTLTFYDLLATYTKSTENANLLLVSASSLYARTYADRRFGWNTTIRGKTLRSPNAAGNVSWGYSLYLYSQDDYFVPKWNEYFKESAPGSGYGLPYISIPLFTTEEVLLNRAEAYAQTGDFADCMNDLNTFGSKRFTNYNPATTNVTLAKAMTFYNIADPKQALINTVLDFKRAEFLFEGMRWFDICRYKMTVTHSYLDGSTPAQNITVTNAPDDPKRLVQLPQSVSLSGIPLNPR